MGKKRGILVAAVLSVVAGYCLVAPTAAQATSANTSIQLIDGDRCERTTSVVHLSATDPTPYRLAGWLCGPGSGDAVQLLVHGFSYDHQYWMGLGQFPGLDYVRAASQAGYTTFAIDQLGAGLSDHPDPSLVTFESAAFVVHQVVGQLHAGQIGSAHRRYRRVVGVGHSMGAGTWLMEAGLYHDTDAVVLTDFLHAINLAWVVPQLRTHYVQANTLPAFRALPNGYLTVEPKSLFYDADPASPGRADPAVIARDEQVNATGTVGQQATLADARDPRLSSAITVPVLEVTGEQDMIGCDPTMPSSDPLSCATVQAVANRERPFFPSTSCLGVYILPGGHDTALHPAAPGMFAYTNWWIRAVRTDWPAQNRAACTR